MIDWNKRISDFEASHPGQTLRPIHRGSSVIVAVWKDTGLLVDDDDDSFIRRDIVEDSEDYS